MKRYTADKNNGDFNAILYNLRFLGLYSAEIKMGIYWCHFSKSKRL